MAYGTDEFGYGGSPGAYIGGSNGQASSLSNFQSAQSFANAGKAADLADPFGGQRGQYQEMLKQLLTNPNGALSNDPTLKFLQSQGQNAVIARNAATGNSLSGGGQVALQDRAMGVASTYIPQLTSTYAGLSGVNSSSPAAAANAYTNMLTRSQGQRQMAVAQQNAPAPGSLPSGGGSPAFGSADWIKQTYPGMGGASDPYNPTTNPTGYQPTPNYMSVNPYEYGAGYVPGSASYDGGGSGYSDFGGGY